MENESKTENKNQVARLLEKHGDRVFRTAFMYLKNYQDAEDVLQMTFEKYLIAKPLVPPLAAGRSPTDDF